MIRLVRRTDQRPCAHTPSPGGKQNFVSKLRPQYHELSIATTTATATVIDTAAPAPCVPILTVFVMKAATNGGSARRIAPSQLRAHSRPAQHRPTTVTAHILKVDSRYTADLTHTHGYFFFPLQPPPPPPPCYKVKRKGKRGSTSVRKQSPSPGRKRGANLQKRGRHAAAVCCTLLH